MVKKQKQAMPATVEAAPVAEPKAKVARYVKGRFALNYIIHLNVQGNPKRGKSAARWELHREGQTVAEFVQRYVDAGYKAGLAHLDLRWEAKPERNLISVVAPDAQ